MGFSFLHSRKTSAVPSKVEEQDEREDEELELLAVEVLWGAEAGMIGLLNEW